MNSLQLMEGIGRVGDRLIQEAADLTGVKREIQKKRHVRRAVFASAAVCACLVVAASAFLLMNGDGGIGPGRLAADSSAPRSQAPAGSALSSAVPPSSSAPPSSAPAVTKLTQIKALKLYGSVNPTRKSESEIRKYFPDYKTQKEVIYEDNVYIYQFTPGGGFIGLMHKKLLTEGIPDEKLDFTAEEMREKAKKLAGPYLAHPAEAYTFEVEHSEDGYPPWVVYVTIQIKDWEESVVMMDFSLSGVMRFLTLSEVDPALERAVRLSKEDVVRIAKNEMKKPEYGVFQRDPSHTKLSVRLENGVYWVSLKDLLWTEYPTCGTLLGFEIDANSGEILRVMKGK